MGRIEADATNNQTRSKYATYGKLDKALRPIYTYEGFSLSFGTEDAPEGMVGMVCFVSHRSGHTRQYRAHVPSDGKGAKGGDVMTKTHAFGSGTSYGMRYLLKMIFNVAIGEEDDDGNAASSDDFRNAVLDDLIAKANGAQNSADLQAVWQSGLKTLQAAKDVAGADELRAAVTARKAELEGKHWSFCRAVRVESRRAPCPRRRDHCQHVRRRPGKAEIRAEQGAANFGGHELRLHPGGRANRRRAFGWRLRDMADEARPRARTHGPDGA